MVIIPKGSEIEDILFRSVSGSTDSKGIFSEIVGLSFGCPVATPEYRRPCGVVSRRDGSASPLVIARSLSPAPLRLQRSVSRSAIRPWSIEGSGSKEQFSTLIWVHSSCSDEASWYR